MLLAMMVPSALTMKLMLTLNDVPFCPVYVLVRSMVAVLLSDAGVTFDPVPLTESLRKPILSQLAV